MYVSIYVLICVLYRERERSISIYIEREIYIYVSIHVLMCVLYIET